MRACCINLFSYISYTMKEWQAEEQFCFHIFLWFVRNMIIQSVRSRTALIIEMTCSLDISWDVTIRCLFELYNTTQSHHIVTSEMVFFIYSFSFFLLCLSVRSPKPKHIMINIKTSRSVGNWMTHIYHKNTKRTSKCAALLLLLLWKIATKLGKSHESILLPLHWKRW